MGSSIETFIAKIKTRPRSALTLLAVTAVAAAGLTFWALPPNTLNPMCTYRAQYRLDATLQVGSELLTSSVVRQSSHSRRWISNMNSGGCGQLYGTALSFRAKDDRVFLIHTDICLSAEKFPQNPVDVIEHCSPDWPNKPIGFTATPTWRHASDDLEKIAPNILGSVFETDNVRGWWNSPDRIISFKRRHGNAVFNVRVLQTRPPRIDDGGERARQGGHRAIVPPP
jgi:hypothetical protein